MKCPHCNYEHGWSGEILKSVEGKEGDFYRHPVKLERESQLSPYLNSEARLYGCPSCMKTFIGDIWQQSTNKESS